MVKGMKRIILFLFCIIVFLFLIVLPRQVIAQVVINEFSSATSNDWVELYSDINIDISGWILRDSASSIVKTISQETIIGPSGQVPRYYVIDVGSRLNSDKDKIVLLKSDDSTMVDQISYGSEGEICAPIGNQTIGRSPNGFGAFVRYVLATDWRENNLSQDPCPTPTSSPSPSPTSSSTSTPNQISYKAIYKISKSKDNANSELTSVQIYVDGKYIHHEDDETLEFYNGHECYSGVDCGLGNHTISLRKSGYISWEDTQNLSVGMSLNVNPVLDNVTIDSETSTPTSTPISTKTPTSKPKATATATATSSATPVEKVLGIETSSPTPKEGKEEKKPFPFLAVGLIVIGLVFITFAVFSIIKSVKKSYTGGDEGKDS